MKTLFKIANLRLSNGDGSSLPIPKDKNPNLYRPLGKERKSLTGDPRLTNDLGGSNLASRKMKPGQMSQKPAIGGERKMKPGQPSLKMSTGGMRKMKGGQQALTNAAGMKVAFKYFS